MRMYPLLLCCALLATGQGQAPPSPCPDVFRYVLDGEGQWAGRVVVPVPHEARRMVVVASLIVVDVVLPPEHPGSIHLVHDVPTVVQQVQTRQADAVEYVLELPTQSPLPLVDKIKVNRKVICQGPTVKAKVRTKVTFTHRLNGLLLRANRPRQRDDRQQSHNLAMVDEGKQGPKNGLELLDNELVVVEVQEAELVDPDLNVGLGDSHKDQDSLHPDEDAEMLDNQIPGANTQVQYTPEDKDRTPEGGKDREEVPESEFHFDDEIELLDNEISEAQYTPRDEDRTPENGRDREEVPESEFHLDDEIELLDNEIPEANDPEVQYTPKDKDRNPKGNKDREEVLESEFDLADEVELMNNEISEANGPEVQYTQRDKDQGTNHNRDREELAESEFDSDAGDVEMLDNEVLEADSPEVQNIPNYKSEVHNFNSGFHVPINEADLNENVKRYAGVELLGDYDGDDVLWT